MRYFFNVSYIGTYFRGAQKQWHLMNADDALSIQGNIELALREQHFKFLSGVTFSSRTDAGVHAFNNTAHVDLSSEKYYDCDKITSKLNKYFYKNNISIAINKTRKVAPDFHSRFNALSRTYIYRLAVPNERFRHENKSLRLPLEEWNRCYLVSDPNFDIGKFKEGTKLFEGLHDFETFRKVDKTCEYSNNIRKIYSITVENSSCMSIAPPLKQELDLYTIKIKGKSFVHNQIRRMLGVLNFLAVGKITQRDISVMLQVPSKNSWPSGARVVPAYGLYLCDVEYKTEDLEFVE